MQRHRDIITKYSGPPGTGKSTTLLDEVNRLIGDGIQPEDIIYTTFTRAGASEAANRAATRFNLTKNRLQWFRTIHSICYSLLEKRPVMAWADWQVIAETIGVHFSVKMNSWDEGNMVPRGQTKGDYLLSLWSYARTTLQPMDVVYAKRHNLFLGHNEVTREELRHFIETVDRYKAATAKIDFTDTLEAYLKDGPLIRPHAVIVDESQDLSFLQWAVIDKLCVGAKIVVIAGDDDQCIHAWNGASPEAFINLEAKIYTVLPQSYRIPSSVHELAQKIIARVHTRLPKDYKPRAERGSIVPVDDLAQLPLEHGSWLLLARNRQHLDGYVSECIRRGLIYTGQAAALPPGVLNAVFHWKQLQADTRITQAEAVAMYKFMGQRDRVTRGFKKVLEEAKIVGTLGWLELHDMYGLVAPKELHWTKALDRIPEEVSDYLNKAEENGGLDEKPRIEIGTIHSAKGKEADFVALRPEMAQRTWQAYEADPDNEHRCWYVGVTRARSGLFLLNSSHRYTYPL